MILLIINVVNIVFFFILGKHLKKKNKNEYDIKIFYTKKN